MKRKPEPRKRAPGGGRKKEGRIRIDVKVTPEAVAKLDAMKTAQHDSRGKVIEMLLGL